jgi:uncharacterized phage protein (TIGR02220 family)
MKNSFLIMDSWAVILEGMPEHTTSEVIKMICRYQMNGEVTRSDDIGANALFDAWKPTLDANNEQYEQTVLARSEAGKKGNEVRWGNRKTSQSDRKLSQSDSKQSQMVADSDSVSVSVNKDISPKGDIIEQARPPIDSDIDEIIDYLNASTSSTFSKNTDATRKAIRARLKAGATIEDFHKVIDHKVEKWGNDERMREYLRPQTLFAPSHFESYLNEANRPRPSNVQSDYARNTGGMAKDNKFMDYDQRTDYDYEALERMLTAN